MPKPEGWTDQEYDQYLEDKAREKAREMLHARIEREGYEADGDDPDAGQTCVNRAEKKLGKRRVHEPCGAKAVVELTMRSPDNPQGLRVPLCRGCLAAHAQKMITLLELFA